MTAGCEPQHLRLPFAAESVGVARHALDDWLAGAIPTGAPVGFLDDCALVVSELVGNAVRHARPLTDGTVDVDWACTDGSLEIAVTDGGGRTAPRKRHAASTDQSGRGLAIVDLLTTGWWVETSGSCTTVRAQLDAVERVA
ncbi:ATP-binding protein [Nocardioides terrisoli]|uniref:ATP-binding protein n=1 Tax=Nocardioides terrisoli TaxID=3388267 RepID=UPI00287B8583|nr:ATP-binding protein [Nocardioides marmorisolisilvae]